MRTCFSVPLLLLAAAAARAQEEIGPSVIPDVKWLAGGPVDLAGAKAKVTVVACYANLVSLRQELDYLQELQRSFRGKSVQVVAVVADEPTAAAVAALEPGVPVAADPGRALITILLGEQEEPALHLAVFHQLPEVLIVTQFGEGPARYVEEILEDKFVAQLGARARGLASSLGTQLIEMDPHHALTAANVLVQGDRHNGLAWGAKYLVESTRLQDADAARATLARALTVLATDPAPLGMMADLILRGDPTNRTLGRELVPALTPAAAQAPRDTHLQLTLLRALVRAGANREVGRLSRLLAKPAGEDSGTALELAEILASDPTPQPHATTAQKALEQAAGPGTDQRLLTAVRYAVTLRCLEDKAAAQKIADDYMQEHQEHVSLNNDAWYLMTQPWTMGRGDALALAMCERMLQHKENLDSFEYDTVAMSMFLNGRVQEAVELQKTALEKGGGSDPDAYRGRLRRYEAALEQAGKDGGKDAGKGG
jgi:hypothetical protein